MQIYDMEQGSSDWFQVRLGIPTASEFKVILAIKKDAREKITRKTYMRKLVGEIMTGMPMENYVSADMLRGKEQEADARDLYALVEEPPELRRVGFIRNGRAGCSPDSLVGTHGMLEIKSAAAHVHLERMEAGALPPEHRAQVQGGLWIAERHWCDFVSYCPGLPLFVVRVARDDGYIEILKAAVEEFNKELADLVAWARTYKSEAA